MNHPYSSRDFHRYIRALNRDQDYATGTEASLRTWILSQPDNSIDPVGLLREALTFTHGNIWNALLSIHQLLRNEARWWDRSRYDYDSNVRDEQAFFNKLIDLRGDLSERGGGFHGDHEGTWYRIFGVFLGWGEHIGEDDFYLRHTVGSSLAACLVPSVVWDPIYITGAQLAVSLLEISKSSSVEDDNRKAEIDRMALRGARTFFDAVLDHPGDVPNLEACARRDYLRTAL